MSDSDDSKAPPTPPTPPAIQDPVIPPPSPSPPEERPSSPPAPVPDSDLPELKTVHSSPPPHDGPPTATISDDVPGNSLEREKLLEQATIFLETAQVRNAPDDEKRAFLVNKGLTEEEVNAMMSTLSTQNKSLIEAKGAREAREAEKREANEAEKRESAAMEKAIVSVGQEQPQSPPPVQPQQQPQQAPIIVAYPEYLAPAPPAPPQPIVTGPTLLKAGYYTAASAMSIYAANKLVLSPMFSSLTSARLSFSSKVLKNLETLTTRLAELAPASSTSVAATAASKPNPDPNAEEGTLFSADVGTQTSTPASHAEELDGEDNLENLNSQLRSLVESHSDGSDSEMMFLLEDLTAYLEGLSYETGLGIPRGSVYAGAFGGYGNGVESANGSKDDPVSKVKMEIRSVKGVLLNTKNFPPAGR